MIYIKDDLKSEKRVLYIIDDYIQIYFVFIFLNYKLNSIIKYLKAIIIYIFRQYNLIIKV